MMAFPLCGSDFLKMKTIFFLLIELKNNHPFLIGFFFYLVYFFNLSRVLKRVLYKKAFKKDLF